MKHRRIITVLIITLFMYAGKAAAQNYPRWWLGAFGGISFSALEGTIHGLDAARPSVAEPDGFTGGNAIGPLGGAMFEYEAGEYLGGAIAVGYDDRSIKTTHTLEGADATKERGMSLTTHIAYLSIEPSFRLGLGGGFSLLAGPTIGLNVAKDYDYTYLTPKSPDGTTVTKEVEGELAEVQPLALGGQLLFQADIPIVRNSGERIALSPFIGFRLRTDILQTSTASSYTTNTFRFGLSVKFGRNGALF
jgi:hypothetical protein